VIRFARQCAAIGRRDLALQRSYGVSGLLGLLAAALGLASYFYMGRLVGGEPAARLAGGGYFPFVWTGVCVQLLVTASLGALAGALAREAAEGTLEPALAAGASPLALVVGAAAAPALLAVAQVGLYALLGVGAFGLWLGDARPAALLAAVAATLAACAPIGLLGAASWLWLRRPGLVTTLAFFAFGVLGGVYFPVALLPAPLAAIAEWVPLALGLDAVRGALLEQAGWRELAPALARLTAIAALGLPLSLAALRHAVARATRRGTLALV
jgi:ABC-type multidrug transport system permease subunit